MNWAGTSCEGHLPGRHPVGEQHRLGYHQKTARTG